MAGKRVLIVDDNVDQLVMLAALLRDGGHTVETATSALYALTVALTFHPEVVFLDIGMPQMDGYQASARFKSHFKRARVFAVTGRAGEEERQKSLAAGFEDHLVKPIDIITIEKILASPSPNPPG